MLERSIRTTDDRRVTLTFWEGLELGAALQVELLQVTELTCTCKTIAQSENSTVPLRAEARSPWASGLSGTRKSMQKRTFREGQEVLASKEVELLQCGAVADACKAQSQSAHRNIQSSAQN